ncbi:MAG: hypothetical protein ACKPBG_12735 [Actinomycetota bacterium]
MHTLFPTPISATADRKRHLHHRSIGLVAVLVVLWTLNVTRIDRTAVDNDESRRSFLDLRDIATRAAMIGESTS